MKTLIIFTLFILLISCNPSVTSNINDDYNLKIALTENLVIKLTWDKITLNKEIKEYEVYKSINENENFIKLATIKSDSNIINYEYTDSFTILGDKTYYYKVRAISIITNEAFSKIVSYKASTDIDGDGFILDDCAANFKNINPQAVEICDLIDNNCNGNIDENIENVITGSNLGECQEGIISCINGEMKSIQEEIPPTNEICDGLDNDCNNEIDNDVENIVTGTNIGECQQGIKTCIDKQLVTIQEEIAPTDEVCDGLDNDCNNEIDDIENIITGTNIGICQQGIKACVNKEFVVIQEEIFPQEEICDNIDNNCDGNIDEELYKSCSNICESGETICIEGHWLGCDATSPTTEEWNSSTPTKRTSFAKSEIKNNNLFIFGGLLPTSEQSDELWKYDNVSKTWEEIIITGTKPIARTYASLSYKFSTNELFLYGGIDAQGNILNDFWKFSITTNQWTPLFARGATPFELYSSTIFNDNYDNIFLFGGKSDTNVNGNTYKYSINENKWYIIENTVTPSPRYNQSSIYNSSSNYVFIFGGNLDESNFSNELWKFNLITFKWSLESSSIEIPDTTKSFAYSKYDNIYFFGGEEEEETTLLKLRIYNITNQEWTILNSEEENSYSSLITDNLDGSINIWGGNNISGNIITKDITFDLSSNTYKTKTDINKLYKAAITYNYNENKNYLFGGYNEQGFSNDLWEYSPIENSWNKIDLGIKPEQREGATITYSEIDNSLYLFGGNDAVSNYGDLWRLDLTSKTNWENLSITDGPSYRVDSYLFYKQGDIYLFGGREVDGKIDLYKLDKLLNKWIKIIYNTTNLPLQRSDYSVIYSPQNDYLFLFGGSKNGEKLNDLWVLDLDTKEWINYHIGITTPTERSFAKFLYDYTNGSLYLFGGINSNNNNLDDVWSLEIGTSNWKNIKTNSNYYAFNGRLGSTIFWVNNHQNHFIYVLGGKNEENYFYLSNKLKISCDTN